MSVLGFWVSLFWLSTAAFCGESNDGKELIGKQFFNQLYPGEDPKFFWSPRLEKLSFSDGTMQLSTGDKEKISAEFKVSLENEIAPALNFSCDCKTESGKAKLLIYFNSSLGKWLSENSFDLPQDNWKKVSFRIPLPPNVSTAKIAFFLNGKNARLSVKNASVKLIAMEKTGTGDKIKIQSGNSTEKCSGIYIMKSDSANMVYDEKAAKILRKYIYDSTGEILPVTVLDESPAGKLKPGMILLGKAAAESGKISESIIKNLKNEGYALNTSGGIVALAGKNPSGVISGTYALIEKMFNAVFITENEMEPNPGKSEQLTFKEMSFSASPVFELRLIHDGEALGYTDSDYIGDARYIGSKSATTCHTAEGLLSFEKYGKEHPEYFAMDKNGRRLYRDPDSTRFNVHFCMSNPDVKKIISERVMEWMKVNPEAKYFYLTFGDGGGKYCHCKECVAMGKTPTDRYIKFVNEIAAKTAVKYPDKLFLTLAYVDTEEAPLEVKPLPNVKMLYCPYPMNWSNHLEAFSEENKEGMRTLDGWLKKCPGNMYIFDYPSCCGEALNIWPAFYANYDKIKFYAEHGIKGLIFCGLRPKGGGSLDLILSMQCRVMFSAKCSGTRSLMRKRKSTVS